jgi:hypothetical protein
VDNFAAAHTTFSSYWYQGYAELSRYELSQARYGDQHAGEAILIYVSEDFSTETETKNEFGDTATAIPVLKLNAHRRFYTGVYPYSILTSVFAPISEPNEPAIKLTASVQEWCGMTYQQFNLRNGSYDMQLRSYFPSEADQDLVVDGLLEDELWTRIRRAPDQLPTGAQRLIPAAHALQLLHRPTQSEPAELSLEAVSSSPYGDESAQRYTIDYPALGRTVNIYFEAEFPHEILAWTEANRGRGESVAVRTNSTMLDYWSRHGSDDDGYRRLLGLEF